MTKISDMISSARQSGDIIPIARLEGSTWKNYRVPIESGGSGATFLVAANNSSDGSKARADYVCDGVADNVEIQAAINTIRTAGIGGTLFLSAGTYYCSDTLDITEAEGITIKGDNTAASIIHSTATGKPAIDIVGSFYLVFEDFRVTGDGTSTPTVAFLMARSTSTASLLMTFERVSVGGSFSAGAWYVFSIDRSIWNNCTVYLTDDASVEFGMYFTAYNDKSYTSAFTTVKDDIHSCALNTIQFCSIEGFDSTAFIPLVISEATYELTVRDCFLSYSGTECDIKIKGAHLNLSFENVYSESLAVDFIVHETYSGSTNTIVFMRVVGCGSDNYTNAIFNGKAGTIVGHALFENLRGPASGGSEIIFATIEYSIVRSWWTNAATGGLTATTAKWCELTYPTSGYTITTSTDNVLRFSGLTDYSGTSTIVGWTSYTTKQIFTHQEGKRIFVQFYIAGTSDDTVTTLTLPAVNNGNCVASGPIGALDDGAAVAGAVCSLGVGSSTLSLYKTQLGGGWTGSGTKEISGQLYYFVD